MSPSPPPGAGSGGVAFARASMLAHMNDARGIPAPSARGLAAAADLARHVAGEVRTSPLSRWLYSTDASIYRVLPDAVLVARSVDDLAAAAEVAARHEVPLCVRGAATSLAGQTLGAGIAVDCFHLDRILEIDPERRVARVEPGVVQGALNRATARLRSRVRARHLDRRAGDDRRHGRQQLVGLALDRLRRDQGQAAARARRARRGRGRRLRTVRRRRPAQRRDGGERRGARGRPGGDAGALARPHRRRLPAHGPPRLGLQPARAARARAQPGPPVRRLRGHAPAVHRARGAARRAAPGAAPGRAHLRQPARGARGQPRHPADGAVGGRAHRPGAAARLAQSAALHAARADPRRRRPGGAARRVPGHARRGSRRARPAARRRSPTSAPGSRSSSPIRPR